MNWWELLQAGGGRFMIPQKVRRSLWSQPMHRIASTALRFIAFTFRLPTSRSIFWQVEKECPPLHLSFVQWNACSPPQVHSTMAKTTAKLWGNILIKNLNINDSVTNLVFFHLKYCVRIVITTRLISFTLSLLKVCICYTVSFLTSSGWAWYFLVLYFPQHVSHVQSKFHLQHSEASQQFHH